MSERRHRWFDDECGELERHDVPYFVYGTLRPGCGNDVWWQGLARAAHDGAVHADGYGLVFRGLPYAVTAPGCSTVGALIVPDDDPVAQRQLRRNLDTLEGHPVGYRRTLIDVRAPDDMTQAWIYLADHRFDASQVARPISDWCGARSR